jgi:hypothetical protein
LIHFLNDLSLHFFLIALQVYLIFPVRTLQRRERPPASSRIGAGALTFRCLIHNLGSDSENTKSKRLHFSQRKLRCGYVFSRCFVLFLLLLFCNVRSLAADEQNTFQNLPCFRLLVGSQNRLETRLNPAEAQLVQLPDLFVC